MSWPSLSVRRPVACVMLTLIVVTLGVFCLLRLPIDLLPEVTFPSLTVRTVYENASPEEVERLITEKIEEAVSLVSGIREIDSESGEGVSNVRIRFVWGTDLDAAADDVRDRIERTADELPEDMLRPELRKFDISNFPIVILGASSPLDPVEFTRVIEDDVLYRFERIPGVAAAEMWGEYRREIRVELDLPRIKALRLPLDVVISALRNANVNLPAGTLERGQYEVTIRTPGEFESVDQLADTVVAVRDGGLIRLRDIAVILDTHQDISRRVRVNGERGVRIAIRKESDANTANVARAVVAEAQRISEQFPQVFITPVIDQGQYIERSIANVGNSVLYGGGLAVLVLLVFVRSLRSTIIIALAIPIAVLATFVLIFFGGSTLNLMTLGGLALGVGMMVDNSIVVLENIFRRRDEEGEDPTTAAMSGANEVASAIIASTATTLVIFLPLAFVTGVSGVLFQQLALVVAFSLLVSLVVALTVVPMLASKLLSGPVAQRRARPNAFVRVATACFVAIERTYQGVLRDALRARWLVCALALACLAACWPLVPLIGTEFMPPSDEGEVRVVGEMAVGTKLELVDRQTRLMESLVYPEVPEMRSAVVSVGASSWNPDDAAEGDMRISLVPLNERTRSNTEIADALREKLAERVPGMEIRTRAPQGQRMLQWVLGSDEGLEVLVRGFDLATLDALAAQAGDVIAKVPGVTDVRVSREAGVPQELVRVDRTKAADLGVSVQSVARALETALGGMRAGYYREGGNEHRILVRLRDARKIPLDQILDITVRSERGEDVALRNLVRIEPGRGPLVIERIDQQRIATIRANLADRDLGSVARDVRAALQQIPRPVGYEFVLAGSYEEQQNAFSELQLSFILALVLVYMVLASQFESLRDPLVVMLSVPTAAVGVVVILFLTNTTLNVQSYIGCITLGGIVVNNAILLVDQTARLRRDRHQPTDVALLEAARRRLRPILMTTLTTIFGLLPLALGIGEGAEAQAPLARAVIGGLTFSTLVTLVLIPAAYSLMCGRRA